MLYLDHEPPWKDAIGTLHYPTTREPRIVCLVPSITELLSELGLSQYIVGRTNFCIRPRHLTHTVPKVGGTKTPDLSLLRQIAPSHIILNIDENTQELHQEVKTFIPTIIVTHPCSPSDNVMLYHTLGGIFHRTAKAHYLAQKIREIIRIAEDKTSRLPAEQVLYLVWKNPWISISRDTYISQTLTTVGWHTPPKISKDRYPCLGDNLAVAIGETERILLSSEPYPFGERDRRQLAHLFPSIPVTRIDGSMTSWYGSRAILGLEYLYKLRQNISENI